MDAAEDDESGGDVSEPLRPAAALPHSENFSNLIARLPLPPPPLDKAAAAAAAATAAVAAVLDELTTGVSVCNPFWLGLACRLTPTRLAC